MIKNIVIIGDLGAGSNIVKNLILLGNNVDWPLGTDKFNTLQNHYNKNVKLKNWLTQEYKLRFWNKFYNIDLADNLNYYEYITNCSQPTLPIVFINHSAFWQIEEFDKFYNDVNLLYVAPTSNLGLEWQIRSYCEKRSVEQLQNFSFNEDIENQKIKYINTNGIEEYYKCNIRNMKEIIDSRQKKFLTMITPEDFLSLETLLYGSFDDITKILNVKFNQDIKTKELAVLLSKWRELHWPLETTTQWKYHDIFE